MAAGEYVSVSSQADTEQADVARERRELRDDPQHEHDELVAIYMQRGLDRELAKQVTAQLTAHDALGAHTRDELGISEATTAHPLQAAIYSAATFAVGAFLPLLIVLLAPSNLLMWAMAISSLVFLTVLGVISAKLGGAPILKAASRVTFWGALAMALTAGVGMLFGVAA